MAVLLAFASTLPSTIITVGRKQPSSWFPTLCWTEESRTHLQCSELSGLPRDWCLSRLARSSGGGHGPGEPAAGPEPGSAAARDTVRKSRRQTCLEWENLFEVMDKNFSNGSKEMHLQF